MSDAETRIAALPIWTGTPRLKPLPGGLSNISYVATDPSGKYVVRLTRDYPFHHVERTREVMSARAAHAAGIGPEIVHAEPGVMVTRFIDGKVLESADVWRDIPRIATLIRHFHTDVPARLSGAAFLFWVFHVNRDYAAQLRGTDGVDDAHIARWLAVNAELEAAQAPMPIVAGHHDLLPANLIDDGSRLWLIDYEYAGFGTAMFDLANLSSNAAFDARQSRQLLELYFDAPAGRDLLRSHAAMEAASLLREALWSLVSDIHLEAPGADYAGYAAENFARFETALDAYRTRYGE